MNKLNFASLRASKKLVDNGIILETNVYWRIPFEGTDTEPHLTRKEDHTECFNLCADFIPAPCFTDVWRELPDQCDHECLKVSKDEGRTFCGYGEYADRWENTNPTDALIDLLIWVKQQNKERIVKKLIDQAEKLKW